MMVELVFCSVPVILLVGCYFVSRSNVKRVKERKISTDNREFEKHLQEVVSAASFTLIDCRSFIENFGILGGLKYSLPANANIDYCKTVTPMQDISPNDLA